MPVRTPLFQSSRRRTKRLLPQSAEQLEVRAMLSASSTVSASVLLSDADIENAVVTLFDTAGLNHQVHVTAAAVTPHDSEGSVLTFTTLDFSLNGSGADVVFAAFMFDSYSLVDGKTRLTAVLGNTSNDSMGQVSSNIRQVIESGGASIRITLSPWKALPVATSSSVRPQSSARSAGLDNNQLALGTIKPTSAPTQWDASQSSGPASPTVPPELMSPETNSESKATERMPGDVTASGSLAVPTETELVSHSEALSLEPSGHLLLQNSPVRGNHTEDDTSFAARIEWIEAGTTEVQHSATPSDVAVHLPAAISQFGPPVAAVQQVAVSLAGLFEDLLLTLNSLLQTIGLAVGRDSSLPRPPVARLVAPVFPESAAPKQASNELLLSQTVVIAVPGSAEFALTPFSDREAPIATLSLEFPPRHGRLSTRDVRTGSLEFAADPGFVGADSAVWRASLEDGTQMRGIIVFLVDGAAQRVAHDDVLISASHLPAVDAVCVGRAALSVRSAAGVTEDRLIATPDSQDAAFSTDDPLSELFH